MNKNKNNQIQITVLRSQKKRKRNRLRKRKNKKGKKHHRVRSISAMNHKHLYCHFLDAINALAVFDIASTKKKK